MAEKVLAYLSKQKNTIKAAEIAEDFQSLEQDYSKKLWNQLGVKTERLVYSEPFATTIDLQEFYENFVQDFQHRINSLQLVHIIWPVAKYIHKKDATQAYEFLERFNKSVATNPSAFVRLETAKIEIRLYNNKIHETQAVGMNIIRKMIEDTQDKLEQLSSISMVHAAFYRVSALYLKEIGDHAAYFREALRYLGCEDFTKLTMEDKRMYATTLSFAALLGKDIYNFGELLTHPVLSSLQKSSEEWLIDMLNAFNHGDMNKFYAMEKFWSQWPELAKNRSQLESKLRMLCLMEMGIKSSETDRKITFAKISSEAKVPLNEVEFLVMKALSRGLIRGIIDQVNEVVNITWIQPRVLTLDQVNQTATRIVEWCSRVSDIESLVSLKAKDILVKN